MMYSMTPIYLNRLITSANKHRKPKIITISECFFFMTRLISYYHFYGNQYEMSSEITITKQPIMLSLGADFPIEPPSTDILAFLLFVWFAFRHILLKAYNTIAEHSMETRAWTHAYLQAYYFPKLCRDHTAARTSIVTHSQSSILCFSF